MNDWFNTAVVVPVLGWVLYVERRLARVASVEERTQRIEAQVDKLVSHLIEDKPNS